MYQLRQMFVEKCFGIVVWVLFKTGDKIWINIVLPVTSHILLWQIGDILWWHLVWRWRNVWWRRCCLNTLSRIRARGSASVAEGSGRRRWNIWKWYRIENSIIWISLFLFFLQIFFEFCSSVLKKNVISSKFWADFWNE